MPFDARTARLVTVETRPRPYPVLIAPAALDQLGIELRKAARADRVAVLTDENVGPLYAGQAVGALAGAGFEPAVITVPAGEASKSLETLARVYDALADARIDRTSTLVALGGGVIGDLGGYAAASWLRGIAFVQCPTSLEADVDASVGGKTAVNHPAGKNLIGAFHQPLFVLIDTLTLATLGERDFRAALAESIKHAVIADAAFFDWHERHAAAILAREPEMLGPLIERNVGIKAAVVARDERETTGERALLNFGHTVGHAIESAIARYAEPWRHGECVAVGMVAAAELSVAAGRLERTSADRIVALLERFGLPTRAPLAGRRDELMALMAADKKVAAGRLRFVLADAIGRAALYADVNPAWIDAALDRCLV
ncbi:MAG: 3-dehydroquinate synthase [Phycisphaerae bacterium]|jgi:3-dehydroquinate synthase